MTFQNLTAGIGAIPSTGFFTEVDVTPPEQFWDPSFINTQIWLDASDSNTIIESAGLVSQWSDKSGKSNNVEQPIGSEQPLTGSRVLNNLNVLDFASDKSLERSNLFHDPDFIWVGVWDVDSGPCLMSQTDAQGMNMYDNSIQLQTDGNTNYIAGAQTGPTIISYDIDRTGLSQASVYLNGTLDITDVLTVDIGEGRFRINANRVGGSNADAGHCEIIVTNLRSDNIRQRIEGYLAWKWGLEANLPVGHPYKSAPPTVDSDFNNDYNNDF